VYPLIKSSQAFKISAAFFLGFARERFKKLPHIRKVPAGKKNSVARNILPASYWLKGPTLETMNLCNKGPFP